MPRTSLPGTSARVVNPAARFAVRHLARSRFTLMIAATTAVSRRAGVTLESIRRVSRSESRSIDGQKGSLLMWLPGTELFGTRPPAMNPLMVAL
ncbi:hypothetical protein D3C79_951170 [compost metagenome]